MKNKSLFWITIILLGVLGFSSCSDEAENKSPFFESIAISVDNSTATVTFSEAVYANADATGNLENSDFIITIDGADFTSELTHVAGSSTMTINFVIISALEGTETITIQPSSATSVYDASGKAMEILEMFTSETLNQAANSPFFESITLSDDNSTVTVTFNESVYANTDKTGNLTTSDILVTIDDVDFTYEVTHIAGETTMTIELTITSITVGDETVTVQPADATSIYDADGVAMEETESITSGSVAQDLGIIGNWYSSGDNVAPLLVTYFTVDSIYAEFYDDFTYLVEQYNIGNTSGIPDLIFTGTFVIEKSNVDEIWTIDITQELPYAATSEGIFEIKTSPEVLWYEVVQTSGTQNIPPTPEGGFGSSNGGTLVIGGVNWNLQQFIRITE